MEGPFGEKKAKIKLDCHSWTGERRSKTRMRLAGHALLRRTVLEREKRSRIVLQRQILNQPMQRGSCSALAKFLLSPSRSS